MDGEEVLSLLKPLGPQHRVMVVSAHTREEYRARARDLGASHYMAKPVDPEELINVVGHLLGDSDSTGGSPVRKSASLRTLDGFVGLVFDEGEIGPAKRLSALGVVLGIVGVLTWLVMY
jgi:DNA-binding response OmpR family regulator